MGQLVRGVAGACGTTPPLVERSTDGGPYRKLNKKLLTGGTNFVDVTADLGKSNAYRVRPVGLARILSRTPNRVSCSSGFVVISSPSVHRPRHYPGGMDVTGVSQLLDHPRTPGGTEYPAEQDKISLIRRLRECFGAAFPLLGEISVWRSVMTGIT